MNQLAPHIFWLTSRAAGIAALLLASASVGIGLLMGGRMLKGKGRMGELRTIHEALTLAPTALEAEIRAKAALLAGPNDCVRYLPHCGVVVHDDGTVDVLG